jgi:hypothetical protein
VAFSDLPAVGGHERQKSRGRDALIASAEQQLWDPGDKIR